MKTSASRPLYVLDNLLAIVDVADAVCASFACEIRQGSSLAVLPNSAGGNDHGNARQLTTHRGSRLAASLHTRVAHNNGIQTKMIRALLADLSQKISCHQSEGPEP